MRDIEVSSNEDFIVAVGTWEQSSLLVSFQLDSSLTPLANLSRKNATFNSVSRIKASNCFIVGGQETIYFMEVVHLGLTINCLLSIDLGDRNNRIRHLLTREDRLYLIYEHKAKIDCFAFDGAVQKFGLSPLATIK